MNKYIDADLLRAEIEKIYKSEIQPWLSGVSPKSVIYEYVLPLIDSLQKEQPEVNLEKELDRYLRGEFQQTAGGNFNNHIQVASHFYGLRNRALEEAARRVYESWMGGTMNDVRRDMVELGKVLNARKV